MKYIVTFMVNNMNENYKITIQKKIQQIFENLKITYNYLKIRDDDLNYEIEIPSIGIFKPLNSISCIFFLRFDDFSSNLLAVNIFKISNKDKDSNLYKIVNDTNLECSGGAFSIYKIDMEEDGDYDKQIIYKSTMNCGNEFSELNDEKVRMQMLSFITALNILFDNIKGNIDGI